MTPARWLALLLPLMIAGCPEPKADRTNARSVALAFLKAVAKGDFDAAESYVAAKDRDAFRNDRPRVPGIPAEPDLEITEKVVDGVRRADVNVRNAKFLGLDMVFENGGWWVTR